MEEQLIDGRYRLLDLLGAGGEARVFRARDLQRRKDVALRLPLETKREVTEIPELEFHPGWAKALESSLDSSLGAYQVFELLEGETLQQKVRRAPLTVVELVSFIHQSLDAVGALHSARWVHGDLNAENFLQVEATSSWKLLELPFLHFSSPQNRSAAFGSIHTLAPEQLQGRVPDYRSDLYALGCLYYYAAAGEYPNAGSTHQEIAISLLRFAPTPLAEKCPGLPAGLGLWIMRLLERDVEKRPDSLMEARRLLGEG